MKVFAPPLTRRRFMQAAAAIGAASVFPWPLRTVLAAPIRTPVLSGTEFQLEIGPVPMNVTGRPMTATGINGQIPAPILRWREGDTVTLAVTNRLSEPNSIHWHGVRTPSPMDGVPGLSFRGIPPGETFVYRPSIRAAPTGTTAIRGFRNRRGSMARSSSTPKRATRSASIATMS
jgi:FtsP/CotA-like multicopper oxidase with cupredoxin domain